MLILVLGGCAGDGGRSDSTSSSPSKSGDRPVSSSESENHSDPSGESSESASSLTLVTYRAATMGTVGTITLAVSDSASGWKLARVGKESWDRVDSLMSNWTQTSEVARVNQAGSAGTIVHPEVAGVIERALMIGKESGGAFDITVEPLVRLWGFLGGTPHVPSNERIEELRGRIGMMQVDYTPTTRAIRFASPEVRIDLGGIAKGYGVDAATEELAAAGARTLMVDLSGNLRTVGHPPGREHWTIGIRDPKKRWPYFAQLRIAESALATSGNYEQFVSQDGETYGHILDPRTGWPVQGILSVTVVTRTAMDADAWATALYVMGPELAKQTLSKRPDLEGIVIAPSGASGGVAARDIVWVESSLMDRLSLVPEAEVEFEVRGF